METTTSVIPKIETLKSIFNYDPETGIITNRINRANKHVSRAGIKSGTVGNHGYSVLSIGPKRYLGHRIAWAMFYGQWPSDGIDHINGIKNRQPNFKFKAGIPVSEHEKPQVAEKQRIWSKGGLLVKKAEDVVCSNWPQWHQKQPGVSSYRGSRRSRLRRSIQAPTRRV